MRQQSPSKQAPSQQAPFQQAPSKQKVQLIKYGRALALAIGFFTRLPTRHQKSVDHEDIGRSIVYMPLIGALLGLLMVGTAWLSIHALVFWHDGLISALHLLLVGLAVFVVLTFSSGALHLDGLGDCADAWVGGLGDKKKTLHIMQDPTSGPIAIVTIVTALMVKAGAIIALTISQSWLPLLLIPMLSRTTGMILFFNTPYVSSKGLGRALADFAINPETRKECGLAILPGLLIPLFLLLPVWPAVIIAFAVWLWLRQGSINRLGGFNGDVCGAVIEIIESILFLSVALFI